MLDGLVGDEIERPPPFVLPPAVSNLVGLVGGGINYYFGGAAVVTAPLSLLGAVQVPAGLVLMGHGFSQVTTSAYNLISIICGDVTPQVTNSGLLGLGNSLTNLAVGLPADDGARTVMAVDLLSTLAITGFPVLPASNWTNITVLNPSADVGVGLITTTTSLVDLINAGPLPNSGLSYTLITLPPSGGNTTQLTVQGSGNANTGAFYAGLFGLGVTQASGAGHSTEPTANVSMTFANIGDAVSGTQNMSLGGVLRVEVYADGSIRVVMSVGSNEEKEKQADGT